MFPQALTARWSLLAFLNSYYNTHAIANFMRGSKLGKVKHVCKAHSIVWTKSKSTLFGLANKTCSWLKIFVKIHYSNGLHIKCIHKNIFLFANIFLLFVFLEKDKSDWMKYIFHTYPVSIFYFIQKCIWNTNQADEKIMYYLHTKTNGKSTNKKYWEFSTDHCLLLNIRFWKAVILRVDATMTHALTQPMWLMKMRILLIHSP